MPYDVSLDGAVTMREGSVSALGRIDQYELVRELGGGGFGTVYLAKDTVSGVDVAVKGLPPFVRDNREEMENIRSNFALVSRLTHTNIAKALVLHPAKNVSYDSEDAHKKLRVDSGDVLMVMEYAPGVTLSQWRKQFPGGKVPFDRAMAITRQIASALDYAHECRIVHRDIKPANVMIETAADGSTTARVLDFGLAAEIRSSMGRVSREIRDTSGTRPYMAPEQWLGGRQGPATDQYALAALLCELLTGEVPFASVFDTGDPVVMMNVVGREPFSPPDDLPKPVRNALAKGLAKKPEDRFASCGELADALEGKPYVSRRKTGRGAPGAPQRGGLHFAVAVKALAAAVALAAFASVWWFGWKKHGDAEKARDVARVKQEVYELEGKASQAREKNEKEEWHVWPHFSKKAKEIEGAFRAGRSAFEKHDYEVAREMFLKVRDNWYWLSSNKVIRAEALAMKAKAEMAGKAVDSLCAGSHDAEGYPVATNATRVALQMFDDGDFAGALAAFGNAASAYEGVVASLKKKVEEENAIKASERKKVLVALDGEIKKALNSADLSMPSMSRVHGMLGDVVAMMPLAMDKIGSMEPARSSKFAFGFAGLACTNCIAFMLDENKIKVNDVADGGLLHFAALCGQIEAIDFLVRRGADVNKQDGNGRTPVCWALEGEKSLATVKHLVAHGARVSSVSNGNSLLQTAAARNQMDVVAYLIEDVGYKPNGTEASRLLADKSASADTKEYLQKHGVRDAEKERLISTLHDKCLSFPAEKEEYIELLNSCIAKYPDDGFVLFLQGNAKWAAFQGLPDYKGAIDCYERSVHAGCMYAAVELGMLYYIGVVVDKDEAKGKALVSQGGRFIDAQAKTGDLMAKEFLARLYREGIDREKDVSMAFRINMELMNKGVEVTPSVADAYMDGKGCEKDTNKAIALMERRARKGGLFDDQVTLGFWCLLEDRKKEAENWFGQAREKLLSAASQGHGGFRQLVCILCHGNEFGFSWNTPGAIGLLEKAASTDKTCAYWLGELYAGGKYVKKDEWIATRWYLKSAEGGYALAQAEVGERYEKGTGCVKDVDKAYSWMLKAANQDISWAQHRVAKYLVNGDGCKKDIVEAVRWLKKSADDDYLPALFDYGMACANGLGMTRNNDEAVKWLTKAGERDHLGAVCALANAYASGNEFARKDMNQAFYWLKKAARLGDEGAREVLKRKNMSW